MPSFEEPPPPPPGPLAPSPARSVKWPLIIAAVASVVILLCGTIIVMSRRSHDESASGSTVSSEASTTAVAASTSTEPMPALAAEPVLLSGVNERDEHGDPIGAEEVLSDEQLAAIEQLRGPNDPPCSPVDVSTPVAVQGDVTIAVTTDVDGCLRLSYEVVPSSELDVSIAEIEARPGVITADIATGAAAWSAGPDPDRGSQWFHDAGEFGIDVAGLDALERRQADPVRVAVVDTGGIDATNPDLSGVTIERALWATRNDDHATHVAGIIAAVAENQTLGRGVARGVHLLDAPVSDGASLQQAILWAVDHGAQVVNMSLCESDPTDTTNTCADTPNSTTAAIIDAARRRGVLFFAAAGNCGAPEPDTKSWYQCDETADVTSWPAAYPRVLSVASYGSDGRRSEFSSQNASVDVSAPGGDIWSTVQVSNGGFGMMSGTSMASPMVAASAAVLVGHRPDLDPGRILSGLFALARDVEPAGWDSFHGAGRIDPLAVARHLEEIDPWQPDDPDPADDPAADDAAQRAAFAGQWTGSVTGASATFRADVTLTVVAGRLSGTIDHPDLPCTGTLTELQISGNQVLLEPSYTDGSACVQGGTHRFTLTDADTIAYEWLHPTSARIDGGQLARVLSAGPITTLPPPAAGAVDATFTFAGPSRSQYSDQYYADVLSAERVGDFGIAVRFDARGASDLRRPESSCLVSDSGFVAVPISTTLDIDEAGHFAGVQIFPAIVPDRWSLRYACYSSYSDAPVGSIDFAVVGVSAFSDNYYATVLSTSYDSNGTLQVRFASHGYTSQLDELRDPATSCVLSNGDELSPGQATYIDEIAGVYYNGTLAFASALPPLSFLYSCRSDYSTVALP